MIKSNKSHGPSLFFSRGTSMTLDEFEFILGRTGAIETTIKEDPKPAVKDVMFQSLGTGRKDDDSDSDNDW